MIEIERLYHSHAFYLRSQMGSIEELGQINGDNNKVEAAKSMMLLTAALAMLKPLMNKEANNN